MRPDPIRDTKAFMNMHAVPSIPGSIPAGTRIVKATYTQGDSFPMGTGGKVLAVMPIQVENEFAYFIEWDPMPGIPVFTRGSKVAKPE